MNNLRFEMGPHSADKDHTIMTGGTLKLDKKVISDSPLHLFHYILPVIQTPLKNVHKGIHSLEHMLAYSVDTGSLRAQIAILTGNENTGKSILDISPYVLGKDTIAFRVSSVEPIDIHLLKNAYRKALETGKNYLQSGGEPPFATPRQCGQYDFHSSEVALQIINNALKELEKSEIKEMKVGDTTSNEFIVCDLRLIKPKKEGNHDQRMLHAEISHELSQKLEKLAYSYLPKGKLGDIRFGTFGCMTGDYVIANEKYSLEQIHIAITKALKEIQKQSTEPDLVSDIQFCLEHIEKNSPSVYSKA